MHRSLPRIQRPFGKSIYSHHHSEAINAFPTAIAWTFRTPQGPSKRTSAFQAALWYPQFGTAHSPNGSVDYKHFVYCQ